MKELFDALPRTNSAEWLLDTCFLYYIFEHQKEHELIKFCVANKVAITSFTVEELLFHMRDVKHIVRERLRHLLKESALLQIVEIPVHPGDFEKEIGFVVGVDEKLVHIIPDHSDAVIAAVAVKLHANILTRDKHHLFTAVLSDYFQEKGLLVKNNF